MWTSLGLPLAGTGSLIWSLSSSCPQRPGNLLGPFGKMPWTYPKRLEPSFLLLASIYTAASGNWFDLRGRRLQTEFGWAQWLRNGKMVFTLLTEVITFHVRPSAVDVQGLGLELISRSTLWGLEECLKEVVYIFLRISCNVRSRGSRNWSLGGPNRSFKSFGGSRFV